MTFASKKRGSLGYPLIVDWSVKQGGKESSCLFNLMMRSAFRTLQEKWKILPMGVETRNSGARKEDDREHIIFAGNFTSLLSRRKDLADDCRWH